MKGNYETPGFEIELYETALIVRRKGQEKPCDIFSYLGDSAWQDIDLESQRIRHMEYGAVAEMIATGFGTPLCQVVAIMQNMIDARIHAVTRLVTNFA